jgi:hypothetical protein
MMRTMKRILLTLLALVVAVFAFAPGAVERHYNTVPARAHPTPSARAMALHRRLTIAICRIRCSGTATSASDRRAATSTSPG